MTQRHPSADTALPLRVLYSFPHPLGGSGIGWTAWNHVRALIDDGHRVDVVSASIARPIPGARHVSTTLSLAGRRIPHRLFGGDRAYDHHDRVASRWCERGEYDVVHTWPLAARRTLLAARENGIAAVREAPNTHTAHAYEVVTAEVGRLGLSTTAAATHVLNPARLRREEAEWSAATAVLVASDFAAATFVERGVAGDRVLRHRYGYLPGASSDPQAGHRWEARPAGAGGLRAVFVGRGEPRKGLHHALTAWRDSDAAATGRFDIYGDIHPDYRGAMAELLAQPSVHEHGFTQNAAAVFAQADVLILPSLEEGSALVTYEAQAAGCALLVSDATGAWMRDGEHGLVHAAGDVSALRTHITMVHRDHDLLSRLRQAAWERRAELTWAAANRDLVAAYRAAMVQESKRHATRNTRGGAYAVA